MAGRSPDEIRASIESNRHALARSVDQLRGEVAVFTDWRGQIGRNQRAVLGGAVIAGFLVGGGVAALGGLFRRRR